MRFYSPITIVRTTIASNHSLTPSNRLLYAATIIFATVDFSLFVVAKMEQQYKNANVVAAATIAAATAAAGDATAVILNWRLQLKQMKLLTIQKLKLLQCLPCSH